MLNGLAAPQAGITVTGYAYPAPSPSDRPLGHIPQELQENERLCMTLHDELSGLEARIGGILRPSAGEAASANGTQPAPPKSECANAVGELNRHINRAIQRVRDLSARADL